MESNLRMVRKAVDLRESPPGISSNGRQSTLTEATGAVRTSGDVGQGDVMQRVTPLRPRAGRVGGSMLSWGRRTHVMGILNATPDSFSNGGALLGLGSSSDGSVRLEGAVGVARRMVREGADILDVGGQSTRPGSSRVSAEVEASRVVPFVRC